jgi:UPF0755 protein
VPGGRSEEEREAARREREARRRGQRPPPSAPAAAAAAPPRQPEPSRDWRAQAARLASAPERSRSGAPRFGPPGGPGPRRGRGARRLVVLALLGVVLLGVAWFLVSLYQPFKGDGAGRVAVVIPEGVGVGEIGDLLEEKGVIASSRFFSLRARIAGKTEDLRPGPYELREDMSYAAVLDRLGEGVPEDVLTVTVPEGLTRAEIAPTVKRSLPGSYVKATRRSKLLDPRDYGAKGTRTLEGFLFPSTYELKEGAKVRALVREQLSTFKKEFSKVDMSYARRKNLTRYDVLIIASLVEREAILAKEEPLIASVIYNRLKQDIRLDIDATTRFAVGNWDSPLKVSELQNQSPYNTRVHSGLPPGPIGNPGIDAIKAAARPAKTDYLFYVAIVCGNGRSAFAATDAEHSRNVAEYERKRAARVAAGKKELTNC